MKAKAFFEKIVKQGRINNDEFNKVIEAFPEIELGDIFPNLFEQEFLTRERAVTDQKVVSKLRAENLDAVDAIIKELVPFLSDKDKVEFQNEPLTFNKLRFLKDAFGRTIEGIKTENPSNDDKIKELTSQNQEYVNKMAAMTKQWELDKTELVKGFEEHKKVMQMDWTLDKRVGEYTFADEYKEVRSTLTKSILDKIKNENVLVLDTSGQIQVHEKTESGVTKQKFNGNDPVTLEKLLEEPLKPFLKKNNGAGSGNGSQGSGNGSQGRQNPATPPVKDPSKMTLAELNRAQMA